MPISGLFLAGLAVGMLGVLVGQSIKRGYGWLVGAIFWIGGQYLVYQNISSKEIGALLGFVGFSFLLVDIFGKGAGRGIAAFLVAWFLGMASMTVMDDLRKNSSTIAGSNTGSENLVTKQRIRDNGYSSDVWTDSATGLQWQVDPPLSGMNWFESEKYCNDLEAGGQIDWRMPSISELRTIVISCDVTKTGGSCKITDDCLQSTCESNYCGCTEASEGRYLPYALRGNMKYFYWSYSPVSDRGTGNCAAWGIRPSDAYISQGPKTGSMDVSVRCVRSGN